MKKSSKNRNNWWVKQIYTRIQNKKESKLVLDELLVAHEEYLKQFKEKIRDSKAQGGWSMV